MSMYPQFLTEKDVSKITGLALSTLRNHRFQRRGIPYHKIGKAVRYKLEDVMAYMDAVRIETSRI